LDSRAVVRLSGGLRDELRKMAECTALLVMSGMGHQTTQQGKSCAAGATRWAGGGAEEQEAPGSGGMASAAPLAM